MIQEVDVFHLDNVSVWKQVEMTSKGSLNTRVRPKPRTGEDMRSLISSISVPTVLRFHRNLAGDSYNVQDMILEDEGPSDFYINVLHPG